MQNDSIMAKILIESIKNKNKKRLRRTGKLSSLYTLMDLDVGKCNKY